MRLRLAEGVGGGGGQNSPRRSPSPPARGSWHLGVSGHHVPATQDHTQPVHTQICTHTCAHACTHA